MGTRVPPVDTESDAGISEEAPELPEGLMEDLIREGLVTPDHCQTYAGESVLMILSGKRGEPLDPPFKDLCRRYGDNTVRDALESVPEWIDFDNAWGSMSAEASQRAQAENLIGSNKGITMRGVLERCKLLDQHAAGTLSERDALLLQALDLASEVRMRLTRRHMFTCLGSGVEDPARCECCMPADHFDDDES